MFAALQRFGWRYDRTVGSHKIMNREGWADYPFWFHDSDELGPAILAKLAKRRAFNPGTSDSFRLTAQESRSGKLPASPVSVRSNLSAIATLGSRYRLKSRRIRDIHGRLRREFPLPARDPDQIEALYDRYI